MKRVLGFAILIALTAMVSQPVQAESITIANSSFEASGLDPGGWTNDLPDWEQTAGDSTSFIEYINGFNAGDAVHHLGISEGVTVSQTLSGQSLAPNTIYELTVGIGNRNAGFTTADNGSTFGISVGGDVIGEMTVNAFPFGESTFEDATLSFTTGASPAVGDMTIFLSSTGAQRAHYDNIRLDAVPVPEPATIALLGLGALMVAGFVRRRR